MSGCLRDCVGMRWLLLRESAACGSTAQQELESRSGRALVHPPDLLVHRANSCCQWQLRRRDGCGDSGNAVVCMPPERPLLRLRCGSGLSGM